MFRKIITQLDWSLPHNLHEKRINIIKLQVKTWKTKQKK